MAISAAIFANYFCKLPQGSLAMEFRKRYIRNGAVWFGFQVCSRVRAPRALERA
jgi:hypothetical protein